MGVAKVIDLPQKPKPKFSARLVLIDAQGNGTEFDLQTGKLKIGRGRWCGIPVPDRSVSRTHAELVWDSESGTLTFQDLKSLNGTFVDGARSDTGTLKDGSQLQVGNIV